MGALAIVKGFFGGAVSSPLKTWGTIIFAALIGFAAGNYQATQHAVRDAAKAAADSVADHAARELAAATGALATSITDGNKRVREAAALHRIADDQAVGSIAAERDAARRDLDAARRLLAAERAKRDAQPKKEIADAANATPVPVGFDPCLFSPDVRRVLDQASGADDSPGDPGADGRGAGPGASGGSAASPTTATEAPELSCDQLAEGYAALGAWGREVLGGLRAWQQWYRDSFGIAPN